MPTAITSTTTTRRRPTKRKSPTPPKTAAEAINQEPMTLSARLTTTRTAGYLAAAALAELLDGVQDLAEAANLAARLRQELESGCRQSLPVTTGAALRGAAKLVDVLDLDWHDPAEPLLDDHGRPIPPEDLYPGAFLPLD